jgi:hypothetical protein
MKWRQKVGRTFFRSGESASARPPLSPAASASARPSSARQHSIFALASVALTPITPHSIRNPPHLVAAVAAACTALRTMPSHRLRLASSPSRGRPDLQPPRRLPISARLIDHRPHCHPRTNHRRHPNITAMSFPVYASPFPRRRAIGSRRPQLALDASRPAACLLHLSVPPLPPA